MEELERRDQVDPGVLGKIGLAISPARPDVVYASIEAAEAEQQGFYRSTDGGESWERRSGYASGGTGAHDDQEIVASPHDVDTVYQMDVFLHVTRDGGATLEVLGTGREKHSDNHALWIDPDDPEHLIAGTATLRSTRSSTKAPPGADPEPSSRPVLQALPRQRRALLQHRR